MVGLLQQITSAGPPAVPDDALIYSPLPATADDGFPQAFLLSAGGVVFRLTMAVYYPDPAFIVSRDFASLIFELPDADRGLYLNLKLEYEQRTGPERLVGARRVVIDLPIALGPLRFRFKRIRVAQGNLRGPGAFGSQLLAEAAVTDG